MFGNLADYSGGPAPDLHRLPSFPRFRLGKRGKTCRNDEEEYSGWSDNVHRRAFFAMRQPAMVQVSGRLPRQFFSALPARARLAQ
jgi:hypothetical protein